MLKKSIFILSALLLSSNAFAQWTLVNDESTVNYVSTKKSQVAEVNGFKQLNGSISDNGKLSVDIDLGSVETHVEKRNERMKSMFFETAAFPQANVSAMLDDKALAKMSTGETYRKSMKFHLSLHGVNKEMTAEVRVVKLANDRIMAASLNPIIVNAGEYDLVKGVEKLREAAHLPSISTAVPVTFNLVFEKK